MSLQGVGSEEKSCSSFCQHPQPSLPTFLADRVLGLNGMMGVGEVGCFKGQETEQEEEENAIAVGRGGKPSGG